MVDDTSPDVVARAAGHLDPSSHFRVANPRLTMKDPNRHAVICEGAKRHRACPLALKARHLLETRGYVVENGDDTVAPQALLQIFIAGQRIGGYDDLRRFLGLEDPARRSGHAALACVLLTAATIAMGASWAAFGTSLISRAAEWFVAIALMLLAMRKLQDIEGFSTTFLGHDLLARRFVPYAYAYPFLEWSVGALMVARVLPWLSIPVALGIGIVGTASIIVANYRKRNIARPASADRHECRQPGLAALVENLAIMGMGLWMLARPGDA